jgi:hypothetical protein
VREVQAKQNDFELGLRHGAFGEAARDAAGLEAELGGGPDAA